MTASGEPTDDPGILFAEPPNPLLPTGGREYGHKGYNLALIVEALSQGLAGHGRADRPTGWGASAYVQIVDPAAFGGTSPFLRQTAFIFAACRRDPPAPSVDAVRLPGERGLARRREARAAGLRLYPGSMDALAPWAERFESSRRRPRPDRSRPRAMPRALEHRGASPLDRPASREAPIRKGLA